VFEELRDVPQTWIPVSGLRASRSRLKSCSASASPAPRRTTPRA
jgi:hypothetical protein